MRIAVITDVHGNMEALQACLQHATRIGFDRLALLGDFIGYGADPAAVLDCVAGMQAGGAIVLRGNHEEAVLTDPQGFNPQARASALWTREQLKPDQLDFIRGLPLVAQQDWCFFAHSSAEHPERWIYVDSTRTAAGCLDAYLPGIRLGVFGHVHRQVLFHRARPDATPGRFDPVPGAEIHLSRARRWAALAGSAGQPRDGNPAASWLLLDLAREAVTFHRVAYDVDVTAQRILAAGLPAWFAQRLAAGA